MNMRKLFFAFPVFVLVAILLLLIGPVAAERVNHDGELTTSDPILNLDPAFDWYYDVYEFTVDTNGVFAIVMDEADFEFSDDPTFWLYEDDFDPGDPFGNLIVFDDDGGEGLLPMLEVSLTECTQYILVVTSYWSEDTGTYAFHMTGEGNIGPNACNSEGPIAGNLLDGRINNDASRDVAAPAAVYCTADGLFDVYAIDPDSGDGTLAFSLTAEQLAAAPPSEHEIIGSLLGVTVYRLTSGEFAIFANFPDGKEYVFVFDRCPPTFTQHPF